MRCEWCEVCELGASRYVFCMSAISDDSAKYSMADDEGANIIRFMTHVYTIIVLAVLLYNNSITLSMPATPLKACLFHC